MSRRDNERRARVRRRVFAEANEDPRYDPLRQRRGRRQIVVVHVAWLLVAFAAQGVLTQMSAVGWPLALAALVWLAGFVLLTSWLNISVSGVTELPYGVLDEAQRAERRRAEADGHRVVQGALFLVALWGLANVGARHAQLTSPNAPEDAHELVWLIPRIPPEAVSWVLAAVVVIAVLLAILPTYLLAWRLPDVAGEHEDMDATA